MGSAGENNVWHHVVEQSQIKKSGLLPQEIHNTLNVIPIDELTHRKINGYYSSIRDFTGGLRVRDWLAGRSFNDQYEFGTNVLKLFSK